MNDLTGFLQLGKEAESTRFSAPTKIDDFKVDKSFNVNFCDIRIRINKNLKQINRKTDSLFDWLGDWGGLYGSLNFIGQNLVSSYTLHQL